MLRRVPRPSTSIALVASLAIACAVGCGGAAANAPEGGFQLNIALQVEELDLANGLHVVLHPERSATEALVYVRYYVGSKDDPQGLTGFAHLYEHLMFRGSRNTGTRDYAQWLEDVGGEANAQTSRDVTDYHARVPPSALPRAIWLEADRMAYPLAALDEVAFTHERSVVENELRQHYDDVPLGNLDAIAREAIFGAAHPYGSTTIGRIADLDRVTLAQARTFGGLYYRPNNAALVICGLFDMAATRALVTRYFGTIPPGVTQPQRSFPPAAPRAQEIAVRAAVEGPAVMLAWAAPGLEGDGADELGYALKVISGSTRRRLVTELKLANDVDVGYDHGRLGGLVTILVKLRPAASAASALTAVDDVLADASRLGRVRSWDNFPDFKTRLVVDEVSRLEVLEGQAARLLHDLELHDGANAMQKDLRRLQSVHAADVGGAVQHFLVDRPRVTITVTPDPRAPRSGQQVAR
jgi:predicted Zn-dependent peptidase